MLWIPQTNRGIKSDLSEKLKATTTPGRPRRHRCTVPSNTPHQGSASTETLPVSWVLEQLGMFWLLLPSGRGLRLCPPLSTHISEAFLHGLQLPGGLNPKSPYLSSRLHHDIGKVPGLRSRGPRFQSVTGFCTQTILIPASIKPYMAGLWNPVKLDKHLIMTSCHSII